MNDSDYLHRSGHEDQRGIPQSAGYPVAMILQSASLIMVGNPTYGIALSTGLNESHHPAMFATVCCKKGGIKNHYPTER
jgi:hypothetical protein